MKKPKFEIGDPVFIIVGSTITQGFVKKVIRETEELTRPDEMVISTSYSVEYETQIITDHPDDPVDEKDRLVCGLRNESVVFAKESQALKYLIKSREENLARTKKYLELFKNLLEEAEAEINESKENLKDLEKEERKWN